MRGQRQRATVKAYWKREKVKKKKKNDYSGLFGFDSINNFQEYFEE